MAFEKKELKKKTENISDWYTDVVLKAEIADYGPVKGTMVIRPYGYALWERVQDILNRFFKEKGVENAYFPMFIPHSLLEKEKDHVEGFSPELAIVTQGGGEELADPLVVRPTSETIMYDMYAKWIHSWRDLPVLMNQWCNVVRWEKRTFLFLRTSEFLWQEGHTAHATEKEAEDMAKTGLEWYRKIYEEYYAMPVIAGIKSESEKFAGAKRTYTVETLMPDGKALQAGTSHNLGQNFSQVFNIRYQNKEGSLEYVWQTSWGFSTRSLGGLFLTHGDDSGLVLPPKMAPTQVVIVPILKADTDHVKIIQYCEDLLDTLRNGGVRVKLDTDQGQSPGRRFNYWEVKGVPIRYEIGMQEVEKRIVTMTRRDTGAKITADRIYTLVETQKTLDAIQKSMFDTAKKFLTEHTTSANTFEEFKDIMASSRGFIKALWCEAAVCEAKIKEETKATTRCLPLDASDEHGSCIYCGKEAIHRWIFAQSY